MKADPFLAKAVFDQLTLRDVIKAANPDEIHVHVGGFLLRFLEWEIHEGRGEYDNVEFFWPGDYPVGREMFYLDQKVVQSGERFLIEGDRDYREIVFYNKNESHGPSEQDTVCSLHPGVPFRVFDRLKLVS